MTEKPKRSSGSSRKRPSGSEDPVFYESLGHAIKVIRTQQRMERKELAEAAGVSYAYLSDIETGRGRPSSSSLLAIAEALGMAPHELMLAAEGNQASQAQPQYRMMRDVGTMAAPSERASRRSWFKSSEMTDAAMAGPVDARVELAAAIEELDPEDLEMVLDLVHRIQGKQRESRSEP